MPKTPHKSSTSTPTTKHNASSASAAAAAATSVVAATSSSSPASASLARRNSRHLTARFSVSMEKDKDNTVATAAPSMSASTSTSTTTNATKGASTSVSAGPPSKQSQSGPVVVKGYVVPLSKDKEKEKPKDPNNPTPWRHPAELPYICRDDWSQDLIIEYLCQKSFSVPAKEHSSAVQLIQVTPYRSSSSPSSPSSSKDVVLLPRAYRVPLMFVAKFQWESLRLVLTSANPKDEWEEYKFDIVHISRLCQHLFEQAREAFKKASALNPSAIPIPGTGSTGGGRSGSVPSGFKATKSGNQLQELGVSAGPGGGPGASALGMKRVQVAGEGVFDKTWRSPMFDRVLTRFYRKWFVSREWSLKNFYEEFDEEEYEIDVLKYDWARWAIKGHKGFSLAKEEIKNGITAEQYMRGLGKTKDGVWSWGTPSSTSTTSASTAPATSGINGANGATANAVASGSQVLAQAEQTGNASPLVITPTIPTATVMVTTLPGPSSTPTVPPAVVTGTSGLAGAPPSFTTVEVKRELLESAGILPASAGKGEKDKDKEDTGDRELSDKFAMITHPPHSDSPPPPPPSAVAAAKPAPAKKASSKVKATTGSRPAPTTASSSAPAAKKISTALADKIKERTSSVSTSTVAGKKRPREEEQDATAVGESVSSGPAQKQRRTMQTARKSMSTAQLQKLRRDQMMIAKISYPAPERKDEEKEDGSEPASSSTEEDDERDGDYKVRGKPKAAGKTKSSPAEAASVSVSVSTAGGSGQKRKSSLNGSSISAWKSNPTPIGPPSTSETGERQKKKAKLDNSASTSSPGNTQTKTPKTTRTAMQSVASNTLKSKRTGSSGSSVPKTTSASTAASASTSKPTPPAPKMMIASTEPVKKASTSSSAKADSSSSAAVGSAQAKSTKPTTTTTAKDASSSTATDPKDDLIPQAPTVPRWRSKPARSQSRSFGPVPGYGYIFSIDHIGEMNANLLGLNMSILGQGARDGTGPQGGHVEAPIPVDLVRAMGKMARWMRAPPKSALELADPITKQALRYAMGDLGLGPKIEKSKDDGRKKRGVEKGKGKAKEVDEETELIKEDKEKNNEEVEKEEVEVEKEKEKEKEVEKEAEKEEEEEEEEEEEGGSAVVNEKEVSEMDMVKDSEKVSETGGKTDKEQEVKESEPPSEVTGSTSASASDNSAKPSSRKEYTDEELIRWLERTYAPGMYEDENARDLAAKALVDKLSSKRLRPPLHLLSLGLSSVTPVVATPITDKPATVTVPDVSPKEVVAPATVVDSPSADNVVLAATSPKSTTPAPRSPSPASSMSISPSPGPEPEPEPESMSSSTTPLLPAPVFSSTTEKPLTVAATSAEVSYPSSPPAGPSSMYVVSPITPPHPPPIVTPHPPIITPPPLPPPITTHSPAPPSITTPTLVRASTTVSPIISAASPSLKGKAMSTILSVLPSMPIQRRSSVAGAVSTSEPVVSVVGSPKVAAASPPHGVAAERTAVSPPEKPTTPVVACQQVAPAVGMTNKVESNTNVDESIPDSGLTSTTASLVRNDNEVSVEPGAPAHVPAQVNGILAPPGAPDMATTAEQMVQEDLAGSKVLEGVLVGTLGTSVQSPSAAGAGDDRMDVDAPIVNGTGPSSTLPTATVNVLQPTVNGISHENTPSEQSVGLLMADGTRSKSLHTILLLRDLLQFLRIPGWGALPREGGEAPGIQMDGANHLDIPLIDPRAHYALLEGEESMTIEQRVDILAHASIALAKALFPFRGSEAELGTRISSLDSRLQQQFELLLKPEERDRAIQMLKEMEKNVEKEEEKNIADETQKRVLEEEVQTEEVQTEEVREKEILSAELGIQTEAEVPEPVAPVVEIAPRTVLEFGIQTENVEEEERKEEAEERKFDNAAIQTEHEDVRERSLEVPSPLSPSPVSPVGWAPHEPQRQPSQLSPDATMVDLTAADYPPLQPKSSVALPDVNGISKMLAPTDIERTNPAAKAMMSIMRNIADLIEYSGQGDSTTNPTTMSAKGKEREVGVERDVEMSTAVERYSGSPVVDAIVSEFRAMKEELRISQLKTRAELDAIKALHRSGIESVENGARSKAKSKVVDEAAQDEVGELKRRHQEEVEQLRETIRKMERDKEKPRDVLEEERIPALELLELRRRISSLESRTHLEAETPSGPTPGPPPNASPAPTQLSESSATHQRHTSHHPLGHLLTHDLDDTGSLASPAPGRSYIREASTNPGTPLSGVNPFSNRQADGMDVDEVMPLPIKSQRKMHMMMFPRPSVG